MMIDILGCPPDSVESLATYSLGQHMDSIGRDIRFFFRTLRRNPSFGLVAVLILGLGVGTTTTIFSVVNSVLLKPLPYPNPSRLVAVTRSFQSGIGETVSMGELMNLRENSETIESVGGFAFTRVPVRVGDTAYLPDTVSVYPELFTALGTLPTIGTNFDLDSADNGATAIISHAFWQRAFNGSDEVVGQPISVQGRQLTVRGVLSADFELPRKDARLYRAPVDLFVPAPRNADFGGFWAIARLHPGATVDRAQAELLTMPPSTNPDSANEWTLRVTPLAEERTNQSRRSLLIFLAIAAVLFLIACVNLMNLLLSRSAARTHELVIRRAVGGTLGRLLRQQLTESACLFLLGAVAGIALAAVGVRFVDALSPLRLPVTRGITIDATVLGFTVVVCGIASILTGIVPAILGSAVTAVRDRRGSGAGVSSRVFPRMQSGLSIVQIGLCVGLLAAAGVLGHSLLRLNSIDPGFERDQVLGFQLIVTGPPDRWMVSVGQALDELQGTPGVRQAGFVTFLPPETWAAYFQRFHFDGPAPEGAPAGTQRANTLMTSTDYFDTVSISILEGRAFLTTDNEQSPPVAIVNQTFARRFFPNDNPLGHRILSEFDSTIGGGDKSREIVGVVNDTRDRGFQDEPLPIIFLPFRQGTLPYGAMAVKTDLAPAAIIPEIRRRLGAANPDVPLADFETLDDRVHDSLKEPRFYALLAASCAILAVLFVTVGIYGVVSYAVSRRTLEFGIRMALGSSAGGVLRNVLWQGARMAMIGIAFGIVLAVATTRLLESLLFDVKPIDMPTLGASVLMVFAVTLFAAYVPARRACKQSPMTALRYE